MNIKRIKFRWIILGILALVYLPQIPGCATAQLPKSGRIVDKETGKGIPNVAVIASNEFTVCGGPIEYRCTTHKGNRVIARTDADGRYWIPNQFSKLDFDHYVPWLLFLSTSNDKSLLTAFKPGYIISDDISRETQDAPPTAITYTAKSASENHTAWWFGCFMKIETIEMQSLQFNVIGLSYYYSQITAIGAKGNIADDRTAGAREAIKEPGAGFFRQRICDLRPATILSADQVSAATIFIDKTISYDTNSNSVISSEFRKHLFALAGC